MLPIGVERHRVSDAFYYIPFIGYFHNKLSINTNEDSSYENYVKTKQKIGNLGSELLSIMIYLGTKDVNAAIDLVSKQEKELRIALYEKEIWNVLMISHRKKCFS